MREDAMMRKEALIGLGIAASITVLAARVAISAQDKYTRIAVHGKGWIPGQDISGVGSRCDTG
jgi:hypothetical protein